MLHFCWLWKSVFKNNMNISSAITIVLSHVKFTSIVGSIVLWSPASISFWFGHLLLSFLARLLPEEIAGLSKSSIWHVLFWTNWDVLCSPDELIWHNNVYNIVTIIQMDTYFLAQATCTFGKDLVRWSFSQWSLSANVRQLNSCISNWLDSHASFIFSDINTKNTEYVVQADGVGDRIKNWDVLLKNINNFYVVRVASVSLHV